MMAHLTLGLQDRLDMLVKFDAAVLPVGVDLRNDATLWRTLDNFPFVARQIPIQHVLQIMIRGLRLGPTGIELIVDGSLVNQVSICILDDNFG